MGKASILVVPVTLVLLALIIAFVIRMVNKIPNGKVVNRWQKNAVLADEAMEIFKSLMIVQSLDVEDIDMLSKNSQGKIKAWAEKYRKVNS